MSFRQEDEKKKQIEESNILKWFHFGSENESNFTKNAAYFQKMYIDIPAGLTRFI